MFSRFNHNLNSKMDTYFYLAIMLLLALLACYLEPKLIVPVGLLLWGIYYYARRSNINRELFFSGYMDNVIRNIERANHYAVRKIDVGIAVFSKEGKLQWKNALFQQWLGKKKLEGKKPEEILPLQPNAFELLSVKDGEQLLQVEGRYYRMRHFSVQTQEHPGERNSLDTNSGLMLFLTDVTDYELLRQKSDNDRLCLAYFRFDNYEEVTRGLSETNIANLNGEINELLTKWTASHNGFICRMNKESCMMGFNYSAIQDMMEEKFTILDKIHDVRSGNRFEPTMSIGISCDGATLEEMARNANNSLNLALGRGGDQAVVLNEKKTLFFGGTSSVSAKSTRVRARIVARTIREQMLAADRIFVMGHNNEDFDAIGSAVGAAKLALALDKETYIVISPQHGYYDKIGVVLKKESEELAADAGVYLEILRTEAEALPLVTPKSLLILVDHHRAALCASKAVLDAIKTRIIVDHHRRAEDIIKDTALLYLEPSSSSASELLSEVICYFDDNMDITPAEATVMYAGIVLDTKNFAVQTGERTFEAAALLRRSGADQNLVRLLFKDDISVVKERARLVAEAWQPVEGLAVTVMKEAVKSTKVSVLVAQAADMLVTADGIAASVVLVEYTDGVLGISARSDGSVNVQVIMETLGGGGHQTVAGVQLEGKKAEDVLDEIVALIAKQLEELSKDESNSDAGY